jgi:hypothetical protein
MQKMPPALAMENKPNSIETLYERVVDYGKVSLDLLKLKAVDKTSDVSSSFVPLSVVLYFAGTLVLFLSLGLALWLGELLDRMSHGFFVVAGLYGVIGVIFYIFLRKPIKRLIGNYVIKMLLK